MAETTRPALEVLHEVVDAWLRRNERRAATEAAFLTRDRWFESGSLQRRVSLTGVFGGSRRKSPAFAGSVSLDVTRERDVLVGSPWPLSLTGIDAVPPEDQGPQREEPKPWPGHTLSRVALQLASRLR